MKILCKETGLKLEVLPIPGTNHTQQDVYNALFKNLDKYELLELPKYWCVQLSPKVLGWLKHNFSNTNVNLIALENNYIIVAQSSCGQQISYSKEAPRGVVQITHQHFMELVYKKEMPMFSIDKEKVQQEILITSKAYAHNPELLTNQVVDRTWTLEKLHRVITNPDEKIGDEMYLCSLWKRNRAKEIFEITGLDVSSILK